MTRIQQAALVIAYSGITALIVLEWISGCGTPDGQCLVIPNIYTTIMGGQ